MGTSVISTPYDLSSPLGVRLDRPPTAATECLNDTPMSSCAVIAIDRHVFCQHVNNNSTTLPDTTHHD